MVRAPLAIVSLIGVMITAAPSDAAQSATAPADVARAFVTAFNARDLDRLYEIEGGRVKRVYYFPAER